MLQISSKKIYLERSFLAFNLIFCMTANESKLFLEKSKVNFWKTTNNYLGIRFNSI